MQQNNSSIKKIHKHRSYLIKQIQQQQQQELNEQIKNVNDTTLFITPNKNKKRSVFSAHQKRFYDNSHKSSDYSSKCSLSPSMVAHYNKQKQEKQSIYQFEDVKQLLLVKAYDKRLFQRVVGSNKANRNFLKFGNIKSDPYRKQTYKVMIQNFTLMVKRIRRGYQKILNQILFQDANKSAIAQFANVWPLLERVCDESDSMFQKVKKCEQTFDSREFRVLLRRFESFLLASKQIQKIIIIVNNCRQKIDRLFKNLQRQNNFFDKVTRQKNRGIKQLKRQIQNYYQKNQRQIEIFNKVEEVLNQVAQQHLHAYQKIKGIRTIMIRVQTYLKQNKLFYSLQDIIEINAIFKEVLIQAKSYQQFVDKFMEKGDLINDGLKSCIQKYRSDIQDNKEAVYSIYNKLIKGLLQIQIKSMQINYSICNSIDSQFLQDYKKIENLLLQISQTILQGRIKKIIKILIQRTKSKYKYLSQFINKIKNIPSIIILDQQNGLSNLIIFQHIMNQYKKNVKQIIDQQCWAYFQITKTTLSHQIINDGDLQQQCLSKIISVSKKLNSTSQKQHIFKCKSTKTMAFNSLECGAEELGNIQFYQQVKNIYNQMEKIVHCNQLNSIIKQLKINNKIYQNSLIYVDIYQRARKVTQKTILTELPLLKEIYLKNKQHSQIQFANFFNRIYCLVLINGFDYKMINIINNNKLVQFPKQHHQLETLKRESKYLQTISEMIPQGVMKRVVCECCETMLAVKQGVKIYEQIKWNKDVSYYIDIVMILKLIEQVFNESLLKKDKQQIKYVKQKIIDCNTKINNIKIQQKKYIKYQNRYKKIIAILDKYSHLNISFFNNLSTIQKYQSLYYYSKVVYLCCEYLKETSQSFYATCNKNGSPFWISRYPDIPPKYSEFGKLIDLPELKINGLQHKYKQISAINVKKLSKQQTQTLDIRKRNNSTLKKQNKKQFLQDSYEFIDQDITISNDERIQQKDIDVSDDIVDADDNIIDDSQISKHFQEKSRKKQRPTTAKLKTFSKLQVQQTADKNDEVTIKEKQGKEIVQKFYHIQCLEELSMLIQKLKNIKLSFWQQIDMKLVEMHFNRESKTMVQKQLLAALQKHCQQLFTQQILVCVKRRTDYKQLLSSFQRISSFQFEELTRILFSCDREFSCLMGVNQQLLRVSIKCSNSWKPSDCIIGYIQKQLKQLSYEIQQFDIEQYISHLIQQTTANKTKYEISTETLQPIQSQKLDKIKTIIYQYQYNLKVYNWINLYQMLTKIWYNFISNNYVEIRIPNKIFQDLQILNTIKNKQQFIYYIKPLKQHLINIINKYQTIKQQIQNIVNSIKKDNLLQSIKNLINICKCQQKYIIRIQQKFVMININIGCQFQKPQVTVIKYFMLSQQGIKNKISNNEIRSKLQLQPEMYLQFKNQISKLLSILQIQSHIWASSTHLHIRETRNETIKLIVSQISNGMISDPLSQLESIQCINNGLVVMNMQSLVFQYGIKDNIQIMSMNNNNECYKKYLKMMQNYNNRNNQQMDVSNWIFESLFGLGDQEEKTINQINRYVEQLTLMLNEEVFSNDWNTIFAYHNTTKSSLKTIKTKINSQIKLLTSLISQQIILNQNNLLSILTKTHQKNLSIFNWYLEFVNVQKNKLVQFKVCPCIDEICEQSYTIYCGYRINNIQYYLQQFLPKSNHHEISQKHIKTNLQINRVTQFTSQSTLHFGKIIRQIGKQINENYDQEIGNFANLYNVRYFGKQQEVNNQLEECFRKLVIRNQSMLFELSMINQLLDTLTRTKFWQKQLLASIQFKTQKQIKDILTKYVQQKKILPKLKIKNMINYQQFINYMVNVIAKFYHLSFSILIDKFDDNQQICVIMGKNNKQIQLGLKKLELPSNQFIVNSAPFYNNIKLYRQIFIIQIDQNVFKQHQFTQLYSKNFGGHQKIKRCRLALALQICYDRKKNKFVQFVELSQLCNKYVQVKMSMRCGQLKANIIIKLVQIQQKPEQGFNQYKILNQLKEQRYENVKLDDQLLLSSIPRQIKSVFQSSNWKYMKKGLFIMDERNGKEVHSTIPMHKECHSQLQQKSSRLLRDFCKELQNRRIFVKFFQPQSIKLQKKRLKRSQLNSTRCMNIQKDTKTVIRQMQQNLPKHDRNEFEQISQSYLNYIRKTFQEREGILQQMIRQAKKCLQMQQTGFFLNDNQSVEQSLKRVMEEVSQMEEYQPFLRHKIIQLLSQLNEENWIIINCIY